MAWTKPMISEISVGLEINSYACAEVISAIAIAPLSLI